jgi:hypothetical protein
MVWARGRRAANEPKMGRGQLNATTRYGFRCRFPDNPDIRVRRRLPGLPWSERHPCRRQERFLRRLQSPLRTPGPLRSVPIRFPSQHLQRPRGPGCRRTARHSRARRPDGFERADRGLFPHRESASCAAKRRAIAIPCRASMNSCGAWFWTLRILSFVLSACEPCEKSTPVGPRQQYCSDLDAGTDSRKLTHGL